MSRKSIAVKFTLMFSLTSFFVAGSVAGRGVTPKPGQDQPPQQFTCETVTDDQIKQAIFKTIRDDSRFNTPSEREKLNFDVTVTNKMVNLSGSVNKPETAAIVLNLIRAAIIENPGGLPVLLNKCYTGINVLKFFSSTRGGCGQNEQDCKGRCISANASCDDFGLVQ